MSRFDHEPDERDPLQLAGDIALNAIRAYLGQQGIGIDEYSVVITLEHGESLATCLHLPGEPDVGRHGEAAFETQLLHLGATASALGVAVRVVPMPRGQG